MKISIRSVYIVLIVLIFTLTGCLSGKNVTSALNPTSSERYSELQGTCGSPVLMIVLSRQIPSEHRAYAPYKLAHALTDRKRVGYGPIGLIGDRLLNPVKAKMFEGNFDRCMKFATSAKNRYIIVTKQTLTYSFVPRSEYKKGSKICRRFDLKSGGSGNGRALGSMNFCRETPEGYWEFDSFPESNVAAQ
jgi:hypothetical protein